MPKGRRRNADESTLIIDGHNVLNSIAGRAAAAFGTEAWRQDRNRLGRLLEEWSRLRGRTVVLVWDGERCASDRATSRIRVLFSGTTAEADDVIVNQASHLAALGEPVAVVTRDRELQSRLPAGVALLDEVDLANDFEAIAGPSITLPGVFGDERFDWLAWLSRPDNPVDLSRLPRRRSGPGHDARAVPDPRPAGLRVSATRPQKDRTAASPGTSQDRSPTAASKEARRRRWERAQSRRTKRGKSDTGPDR